MIDHEQMVSMLNRFNRREIANISKITLTQKRAAFTLMRKLALAETDYLFIPYGYTVGQLTVGIVLNSNNNDK